MTDHLCQDQLRIEREKEQKIEEQTERWRIAQLEKTKREDEMKEAKRKKALMEIEEHHVQTVYNIFNSAGK